MAGKVYGKAYTLKATLRELNSLSGYPRATVIVYNDHITIDDNLEVVILTPSQVRKLRKVIDKHFPLGTSEG